MNADTIADVLNTAESFVRQVILRNCSSSSISKAASSIDVGKIPLSQPVPGLPTPIYISPESNKSETKVTTLSNGLRVATEKAYGKFFTAGVLIDSGSRYECSYPSGVSHFLEKLAFNATENYSNKDDIMKELEQHGGICDCQSSRDTMIYAVSAETDGIGPVMKMLSDVILRPQITDEELKFTKQTISYELEDLDLRPEKDLLLTEMIHAAAYENNTLGLPKFCPAENISVIDRDIIFSYLKNYYTPNRMVLAGVGVEHERLVEIANKYFVENQAAWEKNPELGKNKLQIDSSLSQYTGGSVLQVKDLSDVSLGPTPLPELAHVVIGMESCSHQHEDFIPFCVLNMMMGGGGSFSAGGPGKGMYTRLYTNVLNRFHWMYNATAYNHAYDDGGIFCIHTSAHPSQFANTSGRVSSTELSRAKKQLQSMLLMNLESRVVTFEDMGRQVLSSGNRKQPQYYIDKIQSITENDIRRVAHNMLKTRPSVVGMGCLDKMPKFANIESGLLNEDGKMPSRRFSLFR
ncbi:Mitochondrial-processing peptidase subunit alpha [Nymphon striatum]|nr:Mitochondrial-processing peptidase subunit alpha [Nymphon striatum]